VAGKVEVGETMTEHEKIRVLIADDFDMLREVIRVLIDESEDIEVVGEAVHLEAALEEARRLQPDVILMNDYLPPTDSARATELFRKLNIPSAILIISMQVETKLIEQSLANGANGFMYKSEMGELLTGAIHKVHNNEQFLSPRAEDALTRKRD
jgi:DNA-binding NarL/FixJ family response regulator